jgi:hypothetical protein
MQLAAGVGQHGTGVELLLVAVFYDAIGIGGGPVVVCGALDLNVVVFVLNWLVVLQSQYCFA